MVTNIVLSCKNFVCLFLFAMGLLIIGSDALSFSLGPINVKSQFNENFYAEVPVSLDGNIEIITSIGTETDYARVDLHRNDAVEKISVSAEITGEKKALLKLSSNEPLLQPSFNLLIKSYHNGGTIMENYLIAVDFRKSLSLSLPVKDQKEKKPKEAPPVKEDFAGVKESVSKEVPETSSISLKARNEEIKKDGEIEKNKVDKIESASEKKSVKKKKVLMKVMRGDTLYKIARKIGAGRNNINQVVVSIWMKNINKFQNQNMNLIDKNVILNVDGALNKAKMFTKWEARQIIISQWKNMRRSSIGEDAPLQIGKGNELPLPLELWAGTEAKIVDIVMEWKKSWESRELDRHMTLYSGKFRKKYYNFDSWKMFKSRFNRRHGIFEINIDNIQIRLGKNMATASFAQHFKSKLMETYGTKLLYFKKKNKDFKIIKEIWQKDTQKHSKHPFVVHIGSFRSRKQAVREINILRRKGYSAYDGVLKSDKTIFSRVFIDRFSTKMEAKVFAADLSKLKIVDYAFPMNLPYAVETGSFGSREEAVHEIRRLREIGYSSYPMVKCTQEGCDYQILIGAFSDKENVEPVMAELKRMGIKSSVVAP